MTTDVAGLVRVLEGSSGYLRDDAGEVGFPKLGSRVRRLAGGLARAGLEPGATIGIWLPNQQEWVEAVLAAGLLGARAAVLNPRYRAEELRHAATETGMTHLVYTPEVADSDYAGLVRRAELANDLRLVRIGPDDGNPATDYQGLMTGAPVEGEAGPDDLWVVFFTSGTTSSPKAVVHTQRSLVVHAVHAARRQGLDASGVVLATLPFCGVMGFVSMMEGLVVGAPTVALARFSETQAVELMLERRVTTWNMIDEMLRRVIDLDAAAGVHLHTGALANFAGDPAELLERAETVLGGRILQPYGMSEVQALVTCPATSAPQSRRVRPGGPVVTPGTEMRICEPDTDRELPDGERGELQMRGATCAAGYLRDGGDLHPLGGEEGWFPTGDLGYIEDGELTYLSRFKDAVRLRGFLVNPREIEDMLGKHPDVDVAQVVASERDDRTVLVAFLTSTGPVDPDEVREWCRDRMADFKVPRDVVVLEEFPTTDGPHGAKVRKDVLREWAREE